MDRRIRYTKMVLNESLLHYLEKKEITRITVTEICHRADVNRSTYYSHFTDPFDQLGKLKFNLLKEVTDYTDNIDMTHIPTDEQQFIFLKKLLEYIAAQRQVFQILLTKSGDHNLQHEILKLLGEKVLQYSPQENIPKENRSHLLIYISNGCFGMFYHWLTEEDPITSEQLARLMADFSKKTIRGQVPVPFC